MHKVMLQIILICTRLPVPHQPVSAMPANAKRRNNPGISSKKRKNSTASPVRKKHSFVA
jgi:hypothetical protein